MRDPRKYYDDIDLHPGDIVIESSTGCVGFLVKRTRHIDMVLDDIYFWHITWSDPSQIPNFNLFAQSDRDWETLYWIVTGKHCIGS